METQVPHVSNRVAHVTNSTAEPILSLRGISKRYPGVVALDNVDLELQSGEIHAVVGENGAGKSTLIKIITGVIANDAGEIFAKGAPVVIGSPHNARILGIVSVPQDVLVVPELPIGRNILLGFEGVGVRRSRLGASENELVRAALREIDVDFSPEAPTRSLSVPQLRLAQIARALVQQGDVLLLDEPTAVLSEPDADHVLARLMALRDAGRSIIYISHRLSEIMRIADRVTVLRDGKVVGHFKREEFDRSKIVALMARVDNSQTGEKVAAPMVAHVPVNADVRKTALVVQELSSGLKFSNVSLTVRQGEIIGLAGVQGSGHGYVLRAISGVDNYEAGSVELLGKPIKSGSPSYAFRDGMLLVPADRRGAGIAKGRSIQENIAFTPRAPQHLRAFGFRHIARELVTTKRYIDLLSVHPRLPHALTGNLSGGNQQKVAIARALNADVQVLLADEPTQGIDVRARAEIHDLLRRIAREQNKAVLIASSEFEELIGLVDVIHVMRLGRLVATLPGASASYHDILHEALP